MSDEQQAHADRSRATRRLTAPVVLVVLPGLLLLLAGCGDDSPPRAVRDASVPEAQERPAPVNPYDIADPGRLADVELQLARTGGTCPQLRQWYEANPGDSNLRIARHYWTTCGATPPPVRSGELTAGQVTGSPPAPATTYAPPATVAPPPVPACATAEDLSVSAAVVNIAPIEATYGGGGWKYQVATTVTNRAAAGVSVVMTVEVTDAAGAFLDYENVSLDVEANSSATTTSYGSVTYDGKPAAAAPTTLTPLDEGPLSVIPHHPCR